MVAFPFQHGQNKRSCPERVKEGAASEDKGADIGRGTGSWCSSFARELERRRVKAERLE